jgi:hypothetical protein
MQISARLLYPIMSILDKLNNKKFACWSFFASYIAIHYSFFVCFTQIDTVLPVFKRQKDLLSRYETYKTVLVQNILPRNVLPRNVHPQNVLPHNVLPNKTSSLQNVHRYKTSMEGRYVEGRLVGRTFCSEGRFVEGRFVVVPIKHWHPFRK